MCQIPQEAMIPATPKNAGVAAAAVAAAVDAAAALHQARFADLLQVGAREYQFPVYCKDSATFDPCLLKLKFAPGQNFFIVKIYYIVQDT